MNLGITPNLNVNKSQNNKKQNMSFGMVRIEKGRATEVKLYETLTKHVTDTFHLAGKRAKGLFKNELSTEQIAHLATKYPQHLVVGNDFSEIITSKNPFKKAVELAEEANKKPMITSGDIDIVASECEIKDKENDLKSAKINALAELGIPVR